MRRLLLLGLLAGGWMAAGCAMVRARPLDLAPGMRAVLGRIDPTRLDAQEILVDVVREDGGAHAELYVGFGPRDFALALPPGRYLVTQVRVVDQRQAMDRVRPRPLRVAFEVGPEPAVYVGTLHLISSVNEDLRYTIADDYATTVAALRARYSDLPTAVARSLFRPG